MGGRDTDDDAGVVAAARAGDLEAWEILYRGVYARLWAYLARRVGPQHADDAVSESFCRAWPASTPTTTTDDVPAPDDTDAIDPATT